MRSVPVCSATGTPPIYIALIRNSTALVNATGTATINSNEEANYTCVATSKYGSDVRKFSVVNNGEMKEFLVAPNE